MSLLIRKKYIEKILKYQNTGSIIALTGVRYSGKSTVLKQTYEELKKRNIPRLGINVFLIQKSITHFLALLQSYFLIIFV